MRSCLILIGAALLVSVAARCPNSCSGHGDCGAYDKCACWANWQGFDCADRTCEFDLAWATDYRQNPHYYAECSGKGLCDRTTGLCVCFDGYTGSACKRSVCPNDCSGHGKCRLVAELPNANKQQSDINTLILDAAGQTGEAYPYALWDGDKIQACVCDGEFYGPDCSQRLCPRGDDPLTTCTAGTTGTTAVSSAQSQVQTLTVSSTVVANDLAKDDFFVASAWTGDLVVHYTDNHGEVWTTTAFELFGTGSTTHAEAADNLEAALTALPNFKIPSVSVVAGAGSLVSAAFIVTFDNERNSGVNNLLSCDSLPLGCTTAGCSPWYKQPQSVNTKVNPAGFATAPQFTTDSIFDNAAFGTDQAYVEITVTQQTGELWPTYTAVWYDGDDDEAAAVAPCAALGGPYACESFVPTGVAIGSATLPAGTGVGYNHVPIGYGMYIVLDDVNGGVTAVGTPGTITLAISTVHCDVVQTTAADDNYESLECSGRGSCDASTGVCTCFEGHYGDACGLQTILV